VAFGDDAAVAGGLVSWEAEHVPAFCGDAMADPVTGLSAAAAAFEALARGGGELLDVSMAGCSRALLEVSPPATSGTTERAERSPGGGWHLVVGHDTVPVFEPALSSRGA
jgi:hypothetical protein